MFIQSIANPGASRAARGVLTSVFVLLATAAAFAQSTTATAPPGFKSVFEGYQPYSDEKLLAWKEANDKVARAGGWRTYAREAEQATPATDAAAAPAPARVPAPQAEHSGHSGGTGQAKP